METPMFAVIGLVAGIGINVLADRLPPSAGPTGIWTCPSCRRRLPAGRGVGLWRELARASRCPFCQTRLPRRHVVVEVSLAVLFAFLWQRYGPSTDFALDVLFLAILALIFVIDLEHRLVLNVVVGPVAVLSILTALIRPGLVSALVGAAVGFTLLLAFFLVYPKGLGAGDVKLAGLIGLMLGWPLILQGLLLGFALAAAASIGLLATRRATLRTYIPYAPFLVVGAYLTLLFGR